MTIKVLFGEAQDILAQACKTNSDIHLQRQFEMIRTRRFDKIEDEPSILNNLAIQAASYSVVRKTFKVQFSEEMYLFDAHYSTKFFSPNIIPSYNYNQWCEIVLAWGNALLNEEGLPAQKSLNDLVRSLEQPRKPRPRLVLSLATALPKVKAQILINPVDFHTKIDALSSTQPGKAFDFAKHFSKGIIQMKEALVCNFLKELGLLYFVKVDVHVKSFVGDMAASSSCKNLSPKDQFILSWLLAREAEMKPFFLDKILYLGGVYVKPKFKKLFADRYKDYIDFITSLESQIANLR